MRGRRRITVAHLPDDFARDLRRVANEAPASSAPPSHVAVGAQPTLGEAEIEMIRATLDAAGGNISAASKQLGISRNTIYRKLRWKAVPK